MKAKLHTDCTLKSTVLQMVGGRQELALQLFCYLKIGEEGLENPFQISI